MASRAHPHAMTPSTPGRTRTAPPMTPDGWYSQKRMRRYLLFDATGLVYFLVGFVALAVCMIVGLCAFRHKGRIKTLRSAVAGEDEEHEHSHKVSRFKSKVKILATTFQIIAQFAADLVPHRLQSFHEFID